MLAECYIGHGSEALMSSSLGCEVSTYPLEFFDE
jgi:hypothetical protein